MYSPNCFGSAPCILISLGAICLVCVYINIYQAPLHFLRKQALRQQQRELPKDRLHVLSVLKVIVITQTRKKNQYFIRAVWTVTARSSEHAEFQPDLFFFINLYTFQSPSGPNNTRWLYNCDIDHCLGTQFGYELICSNKS